MYMTRFLKSCFIFWSFCSGNAAPSVSIFQEEAWTMPLHTVKSMCEFWLIWGGLCAISKSYLRIESQSLTFAFVHRIWFQVVLNICLRFFPPVTFACFLFSTSESLSNGRKDESKAYFLMVFKFLRKTF